MRKVRVKHKSACCKKQEWSISHAFYHKLLSEAI